MTTAAAAPAAVPTPSKPAGFELYDPEKDPAVTTQAVTTPPKPEAPVTPAAPVHAAALLGRAAKFGLGSDDANKMTPAELRDWLTDAVISVVAERPAPTVPGTTPANPAAPAAGTEQAITPAVSQKSTADLLTAMKAVVDEDLADAIAAYIDGRLGKMSPERFEGMEAAINHAVAFVNSNRAKEADNQIDAGFEDLGAAFEPIFGKGSVRELGKDSPLFKRRRQVVNELRAKPPQDGNIRAAVASIAKSIFGDMVSGETPAAAPGTPAAPKKSIPVKDPATGRFTKEAYEDAALVLPSRVGSNPEKPPGKAKAVESVRKLQIESAEGAGVDINQGEDTFLG